VPRSAYVGRHRRVRLPGVTTVVTAVAVAVLSLTVVVAGAVAFTGASAPTGGVEGLGYAPPSTSSPAATSPAPPATSAPPSPSPVTPTPVPTTDRPDNSDRSDRAERRNPAPPPEETEPVDEITALEDEVVALTNAERSAAGCGEVRTDERLRTAARLHSEDMATHDYFSHTGRDGSGPGDRAARAGYQGWGGENIAYGYRTPRDVVAGWMDSPGHRANILNCDFVAIGVGLAYDRNGRPYWTQMFGYR
jgi:uncharacterized protein YkwD